MFRCLTYHLGLKSSFEKTAKNFAQKWSEKYSSFELKGIRGDVPNKCLRLFTFAGQFTQSRIHTVQRGIFSRCDAPELI